jgi:hypothetical protein
LASFKTVKFESAAFRERLEHADEAAPLLPAACYAKPIEVDDKQYMPGVYADGALPQDWALMYMDLGGEG